VLTLVKRWSTWAITSKTSPTNPNDTLWSTIVNPWSKPYSKPLDPFLTHQCQPELLPRSPNFTKTLQILPIQKLCVLSRDTTFMLSGIWNLEWKCVKNASQHLQTLFTRAEFSAMFHGILCKIHWSKPYTTFVKVVEGQLIYNFGIDCL
jgi:hypothetical protein